MLGSFDSVVAENRTALPLRDSCVNIRPEPASTFRQPLIPTHQQPHLTRQPYMCRNRDPYHSLGEGFSVGGVNNQVQVVVPTSMHRKEAGAGNGLRSLDEDWGKHPLPAPLRTRKHRRSAVRVCFCSVRSSCRRLTERPNVDFWSLFGHVVGSRHAVLKILRLGYVP
ncbi:hypothetical protein GQ43DRAFT_297021 [Delitschia confertaspora ATCC 74209]|uniref:Uncharacterized protein n=1 Tax=Delitschia confertaspora ATCC 74209 TaxID=1513339 RepID=A0A9P4JNL6_9PLEO|nr:hypothetical protein GQ43DRAFT_297021 [Delitschia confertaspora ATCC 74209]